MVCQPGIHLVSRLGNRLLVHRPSDIRLVSIPPVYLGSGGSGIVLLVQCPYFFSRSLSFLN